MHKLIVFAAFAALVSAPLAVAKERNIALTGVPSVATAGTPLSATVTVTRDKHPDAGKAPTIRLISNEIATSGVINVVTRPTSRLGVYQARLVFPRAGTWRVLVLDRMTGRSYPFGRVKVQAA
jgi:hypothetical protein